MRLSANQATSRQLRRIDQMMRILGTDRVLRTWHHFCGDGSFGSPMKGQAQRLIIELSRFMPAGHRKGDFGGC